MQILVALGLSFPIAALAVFYQDVQHALPIALTVLFYVSPVFYPANLVPGALRDAYLINPVAQVLTAYHTIVYEGRFPSMASVAWLTGTAIVLMGIGYAIFRRHETAIAEVV